MSDASSENFNMMNFNSTEKRVINSMKLGIRLVRIHRSMQSLRAVHVRYKTLTKNDLSDEIGKRKQDDSFRELLLAFCGFEEVDRS
jgi:hypothetical protein